MSDPMVIIRHFRAASHIVGELEHEILQHLVAAGTARGWFPSIANIVSRFSEHESEGALLGALDRLREQHLMIADEQKIHVVVGGITHRKTEFRAKTADGVSFQLMSALDALTIAPTLQKAVTITTTCPVTSAPIEVRFDREAAIEQSTPRSVTAFLPGWDGHTPLYESMQPLGRFLSGDPALEQWQARHRDPPGMPLTEDTIRFVGGELASTLSAIYVAVSVR